MRTVKDETFKDVSKRAHDRPLGRSLGDREPRRRRRLFIWFGRESIDPAGTEPCASHACDRPYQRSFHHRPSFHYRHSFHDRVIDYHDASARARRHAFDRAPHDIGAHRTAHDHNYADATYICSSAGAGQSLSEHAAQSKLLRRLLLQLT